VQPGEVIQLERKGFFRVMGPGQQCYFLFLRMENLLPREVARRGRGCDGWRE